MCQAARYLLCRAATLSDPWQIAAVKLVVCREMATWQMRARQPVGYGMQTISSRGEGRVIITSFLSSAPFEQQG